MEGGAASPGPASSPTPAFGAEPKLAVEIKSSGSAENVHGLAAGASESRHSLPVQRAQQSPEATSATKSSASAGSAWPALPKLHAATQGGRDSTGMNVAYARSRPSDGVFDSDLSLVVDLARGNSIARFQSEKSLRRMYLMALHTDDRDPPRVWVDLVLNAKGSELVKMLLYVLVSVERIARSSDPSTHVLFVWLLTALYLRINSCQTLKLRFMLLMHMPYFSKSGYWKVNPRRRDMCYETTELEMQSFCEQFSSLTYDTDVASVAASLADDNSSWMEKFLKSNATVAGGTTNQRARELLADDSALVKYVMERFFHPERGVPVKDRKSILRTYKASMSGKDILYFLMHDLLITEDHSHIAEDIARFMCEKKLIRHVTNPQKTPSLNEPREPFVNFCNTRNVMLCKSMSKSYKHEVENMHDDGPKAVELDVFMDMLDLQSVTFWREIVFRPRNLEQREWAAGDRYDASMVYHPLVCQDLDAVPSSVFSDRLGKDVTCPPKSCGIVIERVEVAKVFSSNARPKVITLNRYMEESLIGAEDFVPVEPQMLVKSGDNLALDLSCETAFQIFSALFEQSDLFEPDLVPFIATYDVLCTDENKGMLEMVPDMVPMKDFDWQEWMETHGADEETRKFMLRSAAGGYVGCFVIGARDRHFDNILIQSNKTLLHIDFGFLMYDIPPIDGPRFSFPPQMQAVWQELGMWDTFVDLCGKAFLTIRRKQAIVIRALQGLFEFAGINAHTSRQFLMSEHSLALDLSEEAAVKVIHDKVQNSTKELSAFVKRFGHEHVDPVFFAMVDAKFPPALFAMYMVETRKERKQGFKNFVQKSDGAIKNVFQKLSVTAEPAPVPESSPRGTIQVPSLVRTLSGSTQTQSKAWTEG
ncbi:Phosphatidylinositol 4-phosphate 3-kinase C2 domain-containing subunit gamma [Porphyridium purpureum]|uniref:Phosphatidylinositol 4-phosphate 3-kinase C2 domain-containing subunit gamma n=1 Tax=Porphyridium purpureum TaxID=35688 RepID=A0A5J4YI16_PORPP|nr:Phosphatidylinositol 4-phosphate 3-kinase C2 domain-containing subunit gamma [Porphyridium purpureum]|eukprot:POR8010..scf297_16